MIVALAREITIPLTVPAKEKEPAALAKGGRLSFCIGKKARSDPPQDERAFPLAAPAWDIKPAIPITIGRRAL